MIPNALTIEDIRKLIDHYEECIEHAFDSFTKVQDASMELTDYLIEHTPLTGNWRLRGFQNVSRTMSPYTKWIPNYLKKMKHGEVLDLTPEVVIKLEDITKEAGDWKKMFNAAVREYKELRKLYKQSLYNSDGSFNFIAWLS